MLKQIEWSLFFFLFNFLFYLLSYIIFALKIFKINIFSHSLHDQNKSKAFILLNFCKQILSMTAEHTFINF